MDKPRIVVIGSTNTDMVVQAPTLPAPGETVLGGVFRLTPGGKGANQAVAAARAGGAVSFISAVGDDTFGEEQRRGFAAEGIDTRNLCTKAGTSTGVALIMVDAHGENLIAVASGANMQLTPEDIDAAQDAFTGARVAILQLEVPIETVERAMALAAEAGCTVLLNPAPMPPSGLPDAILQRVDIFTPNEGELLALTPGVQDMASAAAQVLARGPRIIVVTQGRRGATVFTKDGGFSLPVIDVHTVDAVGAGDCFSASLGVALAEGRSLADAARFAIAAAGLSTTKPGAQASMPRRTEIEEALAKTLS